MREILYITYIDHKGEHKNIRHVGSLEKWKEKNRYFLKEIIEVKRG